MPSLQKSVGRHSTLTLSALAFHPTGNVQQVLLGPSRCRVSFWVPGYNETDKIPGSLSPQRFRGTERNQATMDNSRGPACSAVADSATPWTEVRQAPPSTGILQARRLKWFAMPSSRRIFPTRGWNSHLLPWQADSWPLCHQGSPRDDFYPVIKTVISSKKTLKQDDR